MEKNEFEKLLIEAHLSKKEFAKKVKMNPNSITNWNSSGKIPDWVESWLDMYIRSNRDKTLKIAAEILNADQTKNTIKKMTKNELYSKLFGFNASTYHRWKNEARPIIKLLQKYCDQNELEEFLQTGKISRLENTDIDMDLVNRIENLEERLRKIEEDGRDEKERNN